MNYLNSKERNAVASLLLTVGVAEDILRSKNTTKEEAKKLKKSIGYRVVAKIKVL